jgi:Protein of unknown function (DUF4446)
VPDLNQWLLDNLAIVVGTVLLFIVGLAIGIIGMNRRLSRAIATHRSLADEASGRPLGEILVSHGERMRTVENRLAEVDGRYRQLADRSRGSLQHVGLVRFNPFDDTGSDQSFAIALLDDEANGIVLSSLHGRAGTRIFAKAIRAGQASHALSDEEQEALRIASERDP